MSYCRWSSDNWRSDVYVYEHCGGWFATHVASNRKIVPPLPGIPMRWIPSFGSKWEIGKGIFYPSNWHRRAAQCFFYIYAIWERLSMWTVGVIPSRPIGLPHDGESFSDDSAGECADRLESLRACGYHIPAGVIEVLRAEAADALPDTEGGSCD